MAPWGMTLTLNFTRVSASGTFPPPRYFGFTMKLTFGASSTSISFILLPETAFACQILIALSEDNYSSLTTLPALWAISSQIQLSVQFLGSVSETHKKKKIPANSSARNHSQIPPTVPSFGGLFRKALLRSLVFIRSTTLRFLSKDSQLTSFARGS